MEKGKISIYLNNSDLDKLLSKVKRKTHGSGLNSLINTELNKVVAKESLLPCGGLKIERMRHTVRINKVIYEDISRMAQCHGLTIADFVMRKVVIPVIDDLEKKKD